MGLVMPNPFTKIAFHLIEDYSSLIAFGKVYVVKNGESRTHLKYRHIQLISDIAKHLTMRCICPTTSSERVSAFKDNFTSTEVTYKG